MRGGGGEKYQKISLIKMSLFMVGGEGLIEIGTMSLSLHFYFFEGLPKIFIGIPDTCLKTNAFHVHPCPCFALL